MIKSTFIIFLVLCSTIPNLSFAQIFDPKISQDYYYRSYGNEAAIRKAHDFLDEINIQGKHHISVPSSAYLDLRTYGFDEKVTVPFYAALERFNYIFSDKNKAIEAIEKFLEIKRQPTTYKLASVITLAIITHNNGDYLKSIKYTNWWRSYTGARSHQLYYMMADNYLKLGDVKNAVVSFKTAQELQENYLQNGPDMRDHFGIEEYEEKVSMLNEELVNIDETSITIENTTEIVPEVSDIFWVAKLTPKFPRAALSKGRTGFVTLNFDLDYLGNPINITVSDRSNSLFIKPAMTFSEDLKYIKYAPPLNQENIATDVTYTVEFEFDK